MDENTSKVVDNVDEVSEEALAELSNGKGEED